MKWFSLGILLALACPAQAQKLTGYGWKRPIMAMDSGWNRIELPPAVLARVQTELQDLRVVGYPDSSLTPFIIWPPEFGPPGWPHVGLRNESWKDSSWFIDLVPEQKDLLGRIQLHFANENFDWKASLQGSHDGQTWFDVVKDERLLAYSKNGRSLRQTDIVFPQSDFAQYRLNIKRPGDRPILQSAEMMRTRSAVGDTRTFSATLLPSPPSKDKESIHYFSFDQPLFLNRFRPKVATNRPFNREARLEYVAGSMQVNGQKQLLWQTLTSQSFSSAEDSVFEFPTTRLQQLRLVVQEGDNEPLKVISASAGGPCYELWILAPKKGNYDLWYGNEKAAAPNFDLAAAVLKMPRENEIPTRMLGDEQSLFPSIEPDNRAKQWWLWVVLAVLVLALGVFGIRLLKTPSAND